MTGPYPDFSGEQQVRLSYGPTVAPPDLAVMNAPAAGNQIGVLREVYAAGLDPAAAFGAAFAAKRVIGHDPVNEYLNLHAGLSPRVASSTPAAAAFDLDAAHKDAVNMFRSAMFERGAPGVSPRLVGAAARPTAEAGVLAARRGAMVGSKLGARMALGVGALSMPGLGMAITAAFWLFDKGERQAVNNLISRLFGGPGAAPAVDAPPEPPRTQFLPLTHDGGRDPVIEWMDQGMVRTNTAAFGFHPDDVWPSAPAIETTSDFSEVATKTNALSAKVDSLIQSLQAAYSGSEEPYVQQMWASAKTSVDALDELKSTVLPAIGRLLMDGANNANNAYQAFREVNRNNRVEINNSTSGMIPFFPNRVDTAKMSDSTTQLKNATEAMNRTAHTLAQAADPFVIHAYQPPAVSSGAETTTPSAPAVAPPTGPPSSPPAAGGLASAPTPTGEKGDAVAKDLASLLRNVAPQFPGIGMPTMPQMPGMGGMPQMAGIGGAIPKANDPLPTGPLDEAAAVKKVLDEHLKEKADDKATKKPGAGPTLPGAAVAQPAGNAVASPGPDGPGVAPAAAAYITEIAGKRWTFDTSKLAALAHNLSGAAGPNPTGLRQAASDAGFRIPPPEHDIGTPVPRTDIKPGDVVIGANNQNAQYLGEQDGKATVITERGELKPLDEVASFTAPHEGIFRLIADEQTPVKS